MAPLHTWHLAAAAAPSRPAVLISQQSRLLTHPNSYFYPDSLILCKIIFTWQHFSDHIKLISENNWQNVKIIIHQNRYDQLIRSVMDKVVSYVVCFLLYAFFIMNFHVTRRVFVKAWSSLTKISDCELTKCEMDVQCTVRSSVSYQL